MNVIFETKAEIVKGTSKNGNEYYGVLIPLTKDYKMFTVLQNADRELVKQMEISISSTLKNE